MTFRGRRVMESFRSASRCWTKPPNTFLDRKNTIGHETSGLNFVPCSSATRSHSTSDLYGIKRAEISLNIGKSLVPPW